MTKTKAEPAKMKDWDAASDLHTLIEAAKIHKHPRRHKDAMAKHKEMLDNMAAVQAQAQMQPPAGAPPSGQPQPGGAPIPGASGGMQ
jgi:hypothetical protein